MNLATIAAILSIYGCLSSVGAKSIVGVSPENQGLYTPVIDKATGQKKWHCLGDPNIILSYDQINDNYCDCPDGSDEPGTNACPYNGQKFYCHNEGHIPGYLESFKVNDGVCDYDICCDGSDEYLTGKCENKCHAIHQQYLSYMQGARDEIQTALTNKNKLITEARKKREAMESGLKSLQREFDLNSQSADKQPELLSEDDPAVELVYSKLSPYLKNLQRSFEIDTDNKEESFKTIEYLENILSDLIENYNPNFNDLAVKNAVNNYRDYISNKVEKRENEGKPLDVLGELIQASEKLSFREEGINDESQYSDPSFKNMIHYYYSSFVKSYMKELDTSHNTRPINEYDEQNANSLKNEIDNIVADLSKDYGENDILRAVQSQWVSKRLGGYSYNIGFLDSIYQDSILIGRYSKHDGNRLIYEQGAKCWNGPRRSGVIEMTCGQSNELISVSEPEKCEYYLEMTSPIACLDLSDEELLQSFKVNYEAL